MTTAQAVGAVSDEAAEWYAINWQTVNRNVRRLQVRVYIRKSDGTTMRPLGIPTMKDRAQQALYLLALVPVVETTADKNSYGFRQQRSCADAIKQCFLALRSANTQWILEGASPTCPCGRSTNGRT